MNEPTAEQLARLPQWARTHIGRLADEVERVERERDEAIAAAALASERPKGDNLSPFRIEAHGHTLPLPRDAEVTTEHFELRVIAGGLVVEAVRALVVHPLDPYKVRIEHING